MNAKDHIIETTEMGFAYCPVCKAGEIELEESCASRMARLAPHAQKDGAIELSDKDALAIIANTNKRLYAEIDQVRHQLEQARREADDAKEALEKEDRAHGVTIMQRDAAENAANALTSEILSEPIDWSDHDAKWAEAVETVTPEADVAELRSQIAQLQNEVGELVGLDGSGRKWREIQERTIEHHSKENARLLSRLSDLRSQLTASQSQCTALNIQNTEWAHKITALSSQVSQLQRELGEAEKVSSAQFRQLQSAESSRNNLLHIVHEVCRITQRDQNTGTVIEHAERLMAELLSLRTLVSSQKGQIERAEHRETDAQDRLNEIALMFEKLAKVEGTRNEEAVLFRTLAEKCRKPLSDAANQGKKKEGA